MKLFRKNLLHRKKLFIVFLFLYTLGFFYNDLIISSQENYFEEIEQINILQASLLAMKRAIKKLKKKPTLVLIDGNKIPELENYNLKPIIKGDKKIPSISAASIIAKVSRDKMMVNLPKKFKGYHLDQNCGYGTKKHLKAIKKLGINKHHRKTFSPIKKLK